MGVALAPANGRGAAALLIDAGAREIYLGFHDEAWTRTFGNADLNRMSGFGRQANVLTFEQLCDEIASVRERFAPGAAALDGAQGAHEPLRLYCTFNAAAYTSAQIDFVAERYLPALAEAGLDGIIISDPQLIEAAHSAKLGVVASTMCSVYNEDIARFYLDRGVRRVIVPRDLSLAEIEAIMKAVPELEYEAFLMRNGCVFADSHCLGLHRANCPSMCRTLRESPWWEIPLDDAPDADEHVRRRIESGRLHKDRFHQSTCGLCALWRLEQAGVNAYKVVGRSDGIDDLCRDVALVARNIESAQSCESEQDYLAAMERPDDILELCGNESLSCYYPEVRFG